MAKQSSYLVTKPYGGVEQDDFLNACVELETLLPPAELLERLHEIEQAAHRERLIPCAIHQKRHVPWACAQGTCFTS